MAAPLRLFGVLTRQLTSQIPSMLQAKLDTLEDCGKMFVAVVMDKPQTGLRELLLWMPCSQPSAISQTFLQIYASLGPSS